jgi:choline dehydrogenase-like flavoprotein
VLEEWCEELGTDELSPEAMKPYFDRVEGILEVAPSSRSIIGPVADVVARGCDALGWSHFAIPRNAPGCDGSGFCDFGCQAEARRGTHISYVPPALERGAVLYTGLRAERIVVENGRAAGIACVAGNGRRVTVRAKTVVLAGGAIPTPLLLLSQGLANSSGQVGRNLSMHPSGGFAAMFDDAISGHTHIPQGYGIDHFLRDGMLILGALATRNIGGALLPFSGRRLMEAIDRLDHIASFGLLVRDTSRNGRVWRDVGVPAITYNVTREDVAKEHQMMVHTARMCLAAGAKRLYPIALGWQVLEGESDLRRFEKARLGAGDIVWGSYHPLGTIQMGKDPKKSVVGLDHQSHDVPGLYVVDGSTVPGPPGVNPQLTIMAMATRAAHKIAAQMV